MCPSCFYKGFVRTLITIVVINSLTLYAFGGKIVYPWNSTTEIVKSGDSFTIRYDADVGQVFDVIKLAGRYNSVPLIIDSVTEGYWQYDHLSLESYNTRIEVSVPSNAPADLYDLVLSTNTGEEISFSAVQLIKEYRSDYTIFHMSDPHLCQSTFKPNGYPEGPGEMVPLPLFSSLIDAANVIGPEIVFVTGDLVNARSWSVYASNWDQYKAIWPSHQERMDFFYRGYPSANLKGVYDITAPVFSINGNHDWGEGDGASGSWPLPDGDSSPAGKARFWNKYHGLRNHHFSYGESRFIAFSDMIGDNSDVQAVPHNNWLNQVGPGKFRMLYEHVQNGAPHNFINTWNIPLGLIGHHHAAGISSTVPNNPFAYRGTAEFYVGSAGRFNIVKVRADGSYTIHVGLEPDKIRKSYTVPNDGTSPVNTATIENDLNISLENIKLRFVMPKGYAYQISTGHLEQVFEGDMYQIVDARVTVAANSTLTIDITNIDSATNYIPIITSSSDPEGVVAESEYRYVLTAVDFNGDALAYESSELPDWLSFDAVSGILSGVPTVSDIGIYPLTLSVSDGKDVTKQYFYISVIEVFEPDNLVLNSSFEASPNLIHWNAGGPAAIDDAHGYESSQSIKITNGSTASQLISIESNTEYSISARIDASQLNGGLAVFDTNDRFDGPGQGQFVVSTVNAGWQLHSGTFNSGANTSVTLRIFTEGAFNGTVFFDEIILLPHISNDSYSDWKSIYGVTSNTADLDNDGMPSFLEYALSGNPNVAGNGHGWRINEKESEFEFVFYRARTDLTYVLEKSTDLLNWSDHVTVSDINGFAGNVAKVPVLRSEMSNGKLFLRLRVKE